MPRTSGRGALPDDLRQLIYPRSPAPIYVADGTIFEGVDYATRIEERLSQADLTFLRCDLTSMPLEHPRPKLAYVFTGGETSVHSDVEWMQSAIAMTRRLIASAQRGECSVIGICLGSQIIAEALRPDSIISTAAIEVGLTPVTTPGAGQVDQLVVPSFHYQAISPEIDSDAEVRIEWGNAHTAVQAFSYGKRVFGCQFHPELSPSDVRKTARPLVEAALYSHTVRTRKICAACHFRTH